MNKNKAAWFALAVLFAINAVNFFDRLVIGAVGEPIRLEFGLDDKMLGLLSTAFTLVYAVVGLPFGRIADRLSRKRILSIGVFAWSLLTGLSGIAQSFWQIFTARLGVGIAEASCAPAATSLIADLFPAEKRARAMSIFMLGLPIGIALSFAVSGAVAKQYGWRAAFFVAGIPGLILAAASLFIPEPERGSSDKAGIDKTPFSGSPFRKIVASPTMRWLIISGAIHNFSLYALSFFLTPLLIRYHKLDIQQASFVAMVINGLLTIPGLLLGGFVGDAAKRWRKDGALIVLTVAALVSAPLFYLGLRVSSGNITAFIALFGAAFTLMYFYYAIVYATIQDVVAPEIRATAMSVYFMVMYVLGGALGPYAVGALSDHFTKQAAESAGAVSPELFEPFRSAGLHSAMYVVPVLSVVLAFVLLMASRRLREENGVEAYSASQETER
jgi:predicted MFS family arabinose efflux permease